VKYILFFINIVEKEAVRISFTSLFKALYCRMLNWKRKGFVFHSRLYLKHL
jgi:hypothetical protein